MNPLCEYLANLLQQRLNEKFISNPSYSLRALARDIGLAPSTCSNILNKKQIPSTKTVEKLYHFFKVEEDIQSKFKGIISEEFKNLEEFDSGYEEFLSHPIHIIIYALTGVEDFVLNERWIASKISFSIEEITNSIKLLKKLDLLNDDGTSNRWSIKFSSEFLDAKRQSTLDFLEIGKSYFEKEVVNPESDFSSLSLAIDKDSIEAAKNELKQFKRDFIKKYGMKRKNQIYHFSYQFFPLSHTS